MTAICSLLMRDSNEAELSCRWRGPAFLYSQLSSLNPQLSYYNGQRLAPALG